MKKTDIIEILGSIQNQVEEAKDRKSKKNVPLLYNLVKDIVSKNTRLPDENQTPKNEINRLVGRARQTCY